MTARITIDVALFDRTSAAAASLTGRLKSINERAEQARAPFVALREQYARFVKLTGIDRIGAGFASVARYGAGAFQSLARIVEPLSVIAGAASVGGILKLASSWAEYGTQLGQTAQRAGLSVGTLQELQGEAKLAGSSAEAMGSGMTTLRDNMVNAQAGKAPEFMGMMQALGVAMRDSRGQMRSTTDLLPELADKIVALNDPTLQAQAAVALFGASGEALLPLLLRGSSGMAELGEKVRFYGLMNEDGVRAAKALKQAQDELEMAVKGVGYAIAERLAPTLVPLLTQMAEWVATNRDWIATGISAHVQAFATWIQGVDWQGVGERIEHIGRFVDGVARFLGGWQAAAEGLAIFFGTIWLTRMLLPIATVVSALWRLPGQARVAAEKSERELSGRQLNRGLGGRGAGLGVGLLGLALSMPEQFDPAATPAGTDTAADILDWMHRNTFGLLGSSYEQSGRDEEASRARMSRLFPTSPEAPNGPPPAAQETGRTAVEVAWRHRGESAAQVNSFLAAEGAGVDARVTAWCAAFVNSSLKAAGVQGSGSAVATSFLRWGAAVAPHDAAEGDVMVLARGHAAGETGGHVGLSTGQRRINAATGREELEMLQGNKNEHVAITWEDAAAVSVRRQLGAPATPAAPPTTPAPAGPARALPPTAGTAANPVARVPAMPNGTVDVNVTIPPAAAASAAVTGLFTTNRAPPPMRVDRAPVGVPMGVPMGVPAQ